jgi:hypothetical protein
MFGAFTSESFPTIELEDTYWQPRRDEDAFLFSISHKNKLV